MVVKLVQDSQRKMSFISNRFGWTILLKISHTDGYKKKTDLDLGWDNDKYELSIEEYT